MEKALKELVLALKSIANALIGKTDSSNNNNEEGGNTDSKNLFLGYNIPDKLVYYEYTGEDDEHGYPIKNRVYFDSLQEAIQYFDFEEAPVMSLYMLYKDLTLDARNCYASVEIEIGKYEGEYYFHFVSLNSTGFDTMRPFTINGESYYRVDQSYHDL